MFCSQLVNGELLKKKKEEGHSVLVYIDTPRFPSTARTNITGSRRSAKWNKNSTRNGHLDHVAPNSPSSKPTSYKRYEFDLESPPLSPSLPIGHSNNDNIKGNHNGNMTDDAIMNMTPIRSNQTNSRFHNASKDTKIANYKQTIHTIQEQLPELETASFERKSTTEELSVPDLQAMATTPPPRRTSTSISTSTVTSLPPPSIPSFSRQSDRQGFSSSSKLTRTQSKEDSIDLDNVNGLIRNGYSFEEQHEDDHSIGSNHTVDDYVMLRIVIGKKNGVLSFLQEGEEENDGDTDDDYTNDFSEHNGNDDDNDDNNNDINDDKVHETHEPDDGPWRDKENYEANSSFVKEEPIFELIPTKNQTRKDHKQKIYHQTRKACLEAAAEAYKDAHLDVPEMILAQINDHRNHLFDKHPLFGNIRKSSMDTSTTTSNNPIENNNSNDSRRKTSEKDLQMKVNLRITNVKLCKTDEIHVAPCQCALRLVGMKERKRSIDSNDILYQLGLGIGHGRGDEDGKELQRAFRHSRTASTMDGRELRLGSTNEIVPKGKNNGVERTRSEQSSYLSADADDADHNNDHNGDLDGDVDDGRNPRVGGKNHGVIFPQEAVQDGTSKNFHKKNLHSRSESNLFTGLEYHEITLICNQGNDSTKMSMLSSKDDDDWKRFVKWDAVTIRCSTHDELDLLVKALRDSSRAKVVPFSSNPKERLKALRAERQQTEEFLREESISNWGVGRNVEEDINGSHMITKNAQMDNPLTQHSPRSTNIVHKKDVPSIVSTEQDKSMTQNGKEPRKKWDLNFNKKEYCELCNLTFTLLTRRHHCRRCERSCCGHCSRLLIEKGCDERRYCNRCASGILQKQSAALRGRSRHKTHDTTLPGKVHEACKSLGVGVVGRLPHWKSFLRPQLEDRPAVGRLTVELIEALALPSVDIMNGNVDPYVRATITGYDRDMKWTLRQWLHKNRYSLCSRFCSATLSPQWRGSGRKGGELLTLPVISTAGAVLRIEVLHYNVLTNSRGKDQVLGIVEIPLSDLPNANLRRPDGVEIETADGKRKSLKFDGYCDRWYRLIVPSDEIDNKAIVLSKPITSPEFSASGGGSRKFGMQSLEEVGKRIQALTIAPVEWFASVIKLDLPARRPEAICQEHKARSMIHVRIKLNASICGDVLSHAWFPPVRPRPSPPPYDPEILFSRLLQVGKETEPFRKHIIQYIEFCIKWQHPPIICIRAYIIFALHLAIFPHVLPLFHLYLFIFLAIRLRAMHLEGDKEALQSLHCSESFDDLGNAHTDASQEKKYDKKLSRNHHVDGEMDHNDGDPEHLISPSISPDDNISPNTSKEDKNQLDFHSSPSLKELSSNNSRNQKNIRQDVVGLAESSSNTSLTNTREIANDTPEEEVTKLNIAIHWIAKRLGDNKGLEVLQFKLGMLGRDLRNLNSVWNGKNPLLTRAAMVYLVISCILHFLMSKRLLWFLGTSTWYFAQAPFCILTARFIFGLSRGVAKVMRRQQLLDSEILSSI